jgi:hypothetical protein
MEGAKLKERFDQIFESARWAKALEDIRKLRKERAGGQKDAEGPGCDRHCEMQGA